MQAITFTQFRNNARRYIDAVEHGEQFQIYRHGKPVAVVGPVEGGHSRYWEERPRPLEISGVSLSEAILAEREEQYHK